MRLDGVELRQGRLRLAGLEGEARVGERSEACVAPGERALADDVREVSGTDKSLAECIAEGTVPSPSVMDLVHADRTFLLRSAFLRSGTRLPQCVPLKMYCILHSAFGTHAPGLRSDRVPVVTKVQYCTVLYCAVLRLRVGW